MEVVVVERNDRVGGRLLSRLVQGQRVNVGGDAWTSANEYLMALMRELPIPVSDDDFGGNGKTGIFDGRRLWPATEFEPITELKVAAELDLVKLRLRKNYEANAARPFHTVEQYARVGVQEYLGQSARAWARRLGLNSFFQAFQWEPLTRTIYDQSLDMTLFGAIVSLLSTERSYAARDGNDSIVKLLLNRSGVRVVLGADVALIQNRSLIDRNGNALASECDYVVVAAPVEMTGIPFPQLLPRVFHHWWVTLVGAKGFNASYFGAGESEVPDSILTLANATVPWTTCAVIAKGNETKIYKCFSNADISALVETQLFEGVLEVHTHLFQHTFPQMVPGTASFQPVVLDNGVIYTGALESVAVARECGIISGYNAARIILQQMSGKGK